VSWLPRLVAGQPRDKTTESPDYDLIRLVSDIGGQLGLWIGVSVITLVEVVQLVTLVVRVVTARRRRRLRPNNDNKNRSAIGNTRQSQTADSAPGAAARRVTLSTRHFPLAIYAGTLCANIINIQHAQCGMVGPDCKKLSRASAACNGYSYAPSPRLRVSLPASAWRRRRAASVYVQI